MIKYLKEMFKILNIFSKNENYFIRKKTDFITFLVLPLLFSALTFSSLHLLALQNRSNPEKQKIIIVSSPKEAEIIWEKMKIRGRVLLYVGPSLPADIPPVIPTSDPEVNMSQAIDRIDVEKIPLNDDIFVYLATLKNIIRKVVWVLPDSQGEVNVKTSFFSELFRKGSSLEGVMMTGIPLIVSSFENIPSLKEPYIVFLSSDSLNTNAFERFAKTWKNKKLNGDLFILSKSEMSEKEIKLWETRLKELISK